LLKRGWFDISGHILAVFEKPRELKLQPAVADYLIEDGLFRYNVPLFFDHERPIGAGFDIILDFGVAPVFYRKFIDSLFECLNDCPGRLKFGQIARRIQVINGNLLLTLIL